MNDSKVFEVTTPIEKLLPHRYPLLLVDKVVSLVLHESIVATKLVSPQEPVFQGHFPGEPIYPGVYLVEGMAQAGCVLANASFDILGNSLLTGVSDARFRKKVLPGDLLSYHVKLEKKKSSLLFFSGSVSVGDDIVASCSFSAWSVANS